MTMIIAPRVHDLGGFQVRRAVPHVQARSIGPFVFVDHMGPAVFEPGSGVDVRPHPHIGLATVTYLFDGAMMHRDSTGAVQRIEPGAVNWMTAGRGIVHSERTPPDLRERAHVSHGLQLWAALPAADEAMAPAFAHTPAASIPQLEVGGATVRVLIGSAFDASSPVAVRSPMLYLDIALAAGDALPLPLATERAIYVVDGAVTLDGEPVPPQTMAVLASGDEPMLAATGPARVALIGGEPLGRRWLWWNFVASDRERLAEAAAAWADGPAAVGDRAARFPQVQGEQEFIPAPAFRAA
jgi:redox-sensitive bicupin YhaK (pirin superfamily)